MATKLNGVVSKVVATIAGIALLMILGLSFSNKNAMAAHSSAEGPHGQIKTDLATIKRDVEWIRKQLEKK